MSKFEFQIKPKVQKKFVIWICLGFGISTLGFN